MVSKSVNRNHHHLLHGVGVSRRRNEEKQPGVGAEGNETKPDQERKPPEISETANQSSNGVYGKSNSKSTKNCASDCTCCSVRAKGEKEDDGNAGQWI